MPRLQESLVHRGLSPILLSQYDAGETSFLFCANEDGSEGVQLDMLYDPKGRGVLRLPSAPLLDGVCKRGPLVVSSVTEEVELVYLWRKALFKRQAARLQTLRQRAARLNADLVVRTSQRLTGATKDGDWLLSDRPVNYKVRSSVNLIAQFPRLIERVLSPSGFWVHIPGENRELAADLMMRFERILLETHGFELSASTSHAAVQYARGALLMRRRAALVVTWGSSARLPATPDLVNLEVADQDVVGRRIVSAMAERLRSLNS